MAITFEATYSKKLGLPNFSSHQYTVTIRTELTDLSLLDEASTRLYGILQDAVDREIQHVGFMPDASRYGMKGEPGTNGERHSIADTSNHGNGRPHTNGSNGHQSPWTCSDRQRELIEKIVRENGLDKGEVDRQAVEMFGTGVKQLDRLQASGLIDELLDQHGGGRGKRKGGYRRDRVPVRGGQGE